LPRHAIRFAGSTIVSILLVTKLIERVGIEGAWVLVAGPVVGLWLFRSALSPTCFAHAAKTQ
jgi:hypothetical protein